MSNQPSSPSANQPIATDAAAPEPQAPEAMDAAQKGKQNKQPKRQAQAARPAQAPVSPAPQLANSEKVDGDTSPKPMVPAEPMVEAKMAETMQDGAAEVVDGGEPPVEVEEAVAEAVEEGGEKGGEEGKGVSRFDSLPTPELQTSKAATAMPQVGAKLRCDQFEGDTSVVCIVEQVHEAAGAFVVRIPALQNRLWPFAVENLAGDRLVYNANMYPVAGQDVAFDEKFRKHLIKPDVSASEAKLVATARTALPRAARPGYTWIKILKGPVSAQGYNWEGKQVRGDHPMGRDEKFKYVEVLAATAKLLAKDSVALDCGVK